MGYKKQLGQRIVRHGAPRRLALVLLLLVAGALFLCGRPHAPAVHAEDARIVTVHIDGETKTIATNADTVKGVLDKLGADVNKNDKTEPALGDQVEGSDFTINVYRARPITVIDGANSYDVITADRSPKEVATNAGFTVNPEDQLSFQRSDDPFEGAPGTQMVIKRAKAVNFDLYGTASSLHTIQTTVGGLLKERGVKLDSTDELNVPKDTPITDGLFVSIAKVGQDVKTEQEDVAFPVQEIRDAQQPIGYRQVKTPGVAGKKLVTYQIVTKNGTESGRNKIKEVVTQEPVTQVVVVGANVPNTNVSGEKQVIMAAAGIAASDYNYVDYIVSHESGWRYNAQGYGTTYGLCQAYPGTKMATAGADWQTNPVTQLRWCNGYAVGRYGSWAAAYNHWLSSHNW